MNGILLINKPAGITSHDVVYHARKALKIKQIGHIGTLDPFATGLMVLLVGRSTKLAKFFEDHDKQYEATFLLGINTDTLDMTGKVIDQKETSKISLEMIDAHIHQMIGKSMQLPPKYAAIKIDGKKLYELARKNQPIPDIPLRPIELYQFERTTEIRKVDQTIQFDALVHCSKGTYIRSIARDLGEACDNYGVLLHLNRTQVGPFHLDDAYTISDLQSGEYQLLEPYKYLNMEKKMLTEAEVSLVQNGCFLPVETFDSTSDTILYEYDIPVAIYTFDSEKNVMRMSVKL